LYDYNKERMKATTPPDAHVLIHSVPGCEEAFDGFKEYLSRVKVIHWDPDLQDLEAFWAYPRKSVEAIMKTAANGRDGFRHQQGQVAGKFSVAAVSSTARLSELLMPNHCLHLR
jgi:hypothetical protein